jgi:hypothetical protein
MLGFYLGRTVATEREGEHRSQRHHAEYKIQKCKTPKGDNLFMQSPATESSKKSAEEDFRIIESFSAPHQRSRAALHQSQFQLIFLVTNPDPVSEWVLALK